MTMITQSHGTQSPTRRYHVCAVEVQIRLRRIAVSNSSVRAVTRPDGSTNADTPETAASTTHRPVSTARIRLICRCWSDAAVKPYDALFTGTTMKVAP